MAHPLNLVDMARQERFPRGAYWNPYRKRNPVAVYPPDRQIELINPDEDYFSQIYFRDRHVNQIGYRDYEWRQVIPIKQIGPEYGPGPVWTRPELVDMALQEHFPPEFIDRLTIPQLCHQLRYLYLLVNNNVVNVGPVAVWSPIGEIPQAVLNDRNAIWTAIRDAEQAQYATRPICRYGRPLDRNRQMDLTLETARSLATRNGVNPNGSKTELCDRLIENQLARRPDHEMFLLPAAARALNPARAIAAPAVPRVAPIPRVAPVAPADVVPDRGPAALPICRDGRPRGRNSQRDLTKETAKNLASQNGLNNRGTKRELCHRLINRVPPLARRPYADEGRRTKRKKTRKSGSKKKFTAF